MIATEVHRWLISDCNGVITDTPNVKAATAQTATVRLSPSSSFLGYLMVSASLSPARMRFSKSVRNLIPMELLSAITNSVLRITRHVIFDVKMWCVYANGCDGLGESG